MQTRRGKFGLRQAVAPVRLSGRCSHAAAGGRGICNGPARELMHRSKRPLDGPIIEPAAILAVARSQASSAGIGCRWSGWEDRCG